MTGITIIKILIGGIVIIIDLEIIIPKELITILMLEEILTNRGIYQVHQEEKVQKVLRKFAFKNSK